MDTRTLTFSALRAAPLYPRRWYVGCWGPAATTFGTGLVAAGAGIGGEITGAGIATTTVVTSWWWMRNVIRPQGSLGRIVRESTRGQRAGGVASWIDVQELASPATLRSRRRFLRPSLEDTRRVDPTELGALLATVGMGRLPGQQVWSTCEDITLRVGGPRQGKSQSLMCHGLDAPGALITTSTRLDLAEGVHQVRGADGRAVHIMNISGEGGVPSTVRWSILTGCTNYATAARRAADLLPGKSSGNDGLDWSEKAREVLAILLHAAAVEKRQVREITSWITAEENSPAANRVCDILSAVEGGSERADRWRQHLSEAPNTRKSVIATLRPSLGWVSDDVARDLGDADPETITLNITRLIEDAETLHLIGREDNTGLAPLITAIVAEVAHEARRIAGNSPGGRLDPPVTMLLDEAAIICPVPLPQWSADMGGRNITLHVSIQSLSQMRERWGKDGASTILGNVGAIVVFGGSKDADDLTDLSILTGEHRQRVLNADWRNEGDVEHRWVPVLTPAQIGALRRFEVLVLRTGLPAVLGWAPSAKDRRGHQNVLLPGDPRTPASGVRIVILDREEAGQ